MSCVFKDEWAEMVKEERTFQRKRKLTSEGTKEGKQKAELPGVTLDYGRHESVNRRQG